MKEPRIDKWLWAARFYKTRSLAQQAVEGGKVHLDGQRVKPSKGVREGMMIEVHKSGLAWTVEVTGLAEKRGSASEAARLYEETAESAALREQARDRRRFERASQPVPEKRPTKKQRRELERLRRKASRTP